MAQKVLRVGSSAAVTIPKQSLEELGLRIGDSVNVAVDRRTQSVVVRPAHRLTREDARVLQLGQRLIQRYRRDFDALARQ